MKVRSGFVSNSSSSSFIVAVDKDASTEIKVVLKANLETYADRKISTIEELNDYYDDYWGEREYRYEECRKAIEAGKTILVGSFDDQSGDRTEEFLCDSGIPDSEDYDVIQSEGGYQ